MTLGANTPALGADPGWIVRIWRTPLLTKLVIVDVGVDLVTLAGLQWTPPELVTEVSVLSMAVIGVLNATLVTWALRPLAILEDTARRVSAGEFTARSRMPPFTDRNLARIGQTLDTLLDHVETDRARLRTLAAEVVAAGDRERAHIARELHDGTAQSLSALDMLLATSLASATSEAEGQRLGVMREIVTEALGEVRALARSVHPRVLDDLGLAAALATLARRTRDAGGPEVTVETNGSRDLPRAVSAVLYRVAQEAVHNAVKHADARRVQVTLSLTDDRATLDVSDDGCGFARDPRGTGMGLFVMQERVGLVDGSFALRSSPGAGTHVHAEVPLAGPVEPPALGGAR